MQDFVVGVLAIGVGGLLLARGYLAMRVVIAVWGAFAGLMLGAGIVGVTSDSGFLRSALGWIVGVALAIMFGLLAYLYYEVSVFLAMSAIGFALGAGLMGALGIDWTWLVVLVGIAVGVLLAIAAIVADLPGILLVVITASGGATVVTFGIMLVTNLFDTADFETTDVTEQLDAPWFWYLVYFGLFIAGVFLQFANAQRDKASARAQWTNTGGRQLRTA